jgi:hypothetical protein
MMKRIVFMIVVLALIAAPLALFAKGGSEQATSATGGQSRPVVFMNTMGHTASDEFYKRVHDYIEKQTGVQFTYRDVTNSADYDAQLTAALAAQEQIDAFGTNQTNLPNDISKGVIQDITDPLKANGPNILKLFNNPPGWTNLQTGAMWLPVTVNGRIWAIPGATSKDVGVVLSVRKDWREKLGIGPITTIDDFEKYLRAVKAADPAGGGQTIPFNPMYGSSGLEGIAATMVYPFVGSHGWMHAWYNSVYISPDGKVTPTILHPNFKAFLSRMALWYKDGLINPDVLTSSWDNDVDLVAANRVGATASWYSDFYNGWKTLVTKVPDASYEIDVLKGPDNGPAEFELNNPSAAQWSYTSWAPKDIVAAGIKLQDWFAANKDNYLVQIHGVQGTDWEYVNKGDITQRPQIKHISDKDYYSFSFLSYNNWNGVVMGNNDWNVVQYRKANEFLNTQLPWFNPDWFVAFNWKDTPIEKNYNDASTFINEAIANVILGRSTLADWDEAVAQYKSMWGDAFVKSATDQYNAAKASAGLK